MSGPDIWPFHARAFLGDTEKLTPAETGAYIRLLIFYWHNRGLPKEDAQLRLITGLEAPAWNRSRARLKALFRDGWRHERADRDLAYATQLSGKRRAAAVVRWEKNTGDKKMSRESSTCIGRHELFQALNNFPTHAHAMPKESIDRIPSISGSPGAVEKWPPMSQASALPNNNGSSKAHRQAQQAWETALRRRLGKHYGKAIDVLAADPALVERATRAEMQKPGSGVVAVLIGLRGKLVSTTGDDFV